MKAIVVTMMSKVMPVAITAAICAFPVLASSGNVAYASAPNPSPYAPSGYTLTFSDDFNGTSLDTSKWNYRTDSRFDANWDSVQLASNVSVSGGDLVINGIVDDPAQSGHNSGGGVISKQLFKYGYYEARAKTQTETGWHSAYWTMASNAIYTALETEIDIFERESGYGVNHITNNVIQHAPAACIPGCRNFALTFDPAAAYHVYGMLWEEDQVKFYTDGVLNTTISYADQTYAQDYNNIWLTMIGGISSTANSSVHFDYAQYYAPPAVSYPGAIVLDNTSAAGIAKTGTWTSSASIAGYKGTDFLFSNGGSANTIKYTPTIPASGSYDVYVWYESHPNRSNAVPLEIGYNGGASTDTSKTLNEKVNGTNWVLVGTYNFNAGTGNYLKIVGAASDYTTADSVMFVPH